MVEMSSQTTVRLASMPYICPRKQGGVGQQFSWRPRKKAFMIGAATAQQMSVVLISKLYSKSREDFVIQNRRMPPIRIKGTSVSMRDYTF